MTDQLSSSEAAARARAENFPVASRLLPRARRVELLAVYRFARAVDELGDSLAGDRLQALDEVDDDLRRLAEDRSPRWSAVADLVQPVRAHAIPLGLFHDLVEANRRDQAVHRYATYGDLRGYCAMSADPVGRIVLHLFDAATPARIAWSDDVCTALQLVEHWQDIAEDRRRGRVYLPQEDLARFGCAEADLDAATASPGVRALVAFETDRAAALLASGEPLVGSLHGAARLAVAGFVGGGRATVAALRRIDHDVLARTARPTRPRVALEWARTLGRAGRRTPTGA